MPVGEERPEAVPVVAARPQMVVHDVEHDGQAARVRTVTIRSAGPRTPSGSDMTKRASYDVPGSRSRMLPANMFGAMTSTRDSA